MAVKIPPHRTPIKMTGVPKEGWVQIAHGRIFYPLDPKAEDVFIDDIAQGLSRQNRFNGQSDLIINVAQHSCQAAWLAEQDGHDAFIQLAMLMHDAAEYVVGDLIRPIKVNTPGFQETEDAIMKVIVEKFHLPVINHDLQKYYDDLALAWEKRDMYWSAREWPGLPNVPEWCPEMKTWTSDYSEARFLLLFQWLMYDVEFLRSSD